MIKKCFLLFAFLVSFLVSSCEFFNLNDDDDEEDYNSQVTGLTLTVKDDNGTAQTTTNITAGDSEYFELSVSPSNIQSKVDIEWIYEKDYISVVSHDNYGIIIQAKDGYSGGTYLKAKCNGIISTCLISIESAAIETEEYIYSSDSVVQIMPGNTQTISVALYGGSSDDMENFEWSISDSSIADISVARNNCVITAKKVGSTQIVVSHPLAEYDYTIVLFVYADAMNQPYITTSDNVVTIDKNSESSKVISVDLVNPLDVYYKMGFTWDYADEESKEFLSLSSNYNECTITPEATGLARIKISHTNAQYDLIILVRVITVVENVYISISPSSTAVIKGSSTRTAIKANIENYTGAVDYNKFKWEYVSLTGDNSVSVSEDELSNYATIDINDDTFNIIGKKNIVIRLYVSHPLAATKRKVVIILEEQDGSAIDSSMYITTSDNYVQTKVGAVGDSDEWPYVTVDLKGGTDGDEKDFIWNIDGGYDNGIVELETVTGTIKNSRAVVSVSGDAYAYLYYKPIAAGTVKISVEHPRCLYKTDITIKVYSQYALLSPMVTIDADCGSVLRLVNNDSTNGSVTVTASMENANSGDENNLTWSSADETNVSVSPATGLSSVISAIGSGKHYTYVTINHEDAYAPKKILVLSADTLEEVESMKAIYSDVSYLRVSCEKGNNTATVELTGVGLEDGDKVSWTSSDSSIFSVEPDTTSDNYLKATVTGYKEGKGTLTATLDSISVEFDVVVVPTAEEVSTIEKVKYLTTTNNNVVMTEEGDCADLTVTGVNIDDMLNSSWEYKDSLEKTGTNSVSDSDAAFAMVTNSSSGLTTATLTAQNKGKATLKVTNPESKNDLDITAKYGEVYEWLSYTVYIDGSDTINIVKGNSTTTAFSLVNTTSSGTWSYEVTQGKDLVNVDDITSGGLLMFKAVKAGQAVITIRNTLSEIEKEVLVNIANSADELSDFVYLTTEQNVVTVYTGSNETVSISVVNSNLTSGFKWEPDDSNIVSVQSSGTIAVIYGKSAGSTKLTVSNDALDWPLEIIVNVVNEDVVSEDPYISAENITTITEGDSATLTASLIGGDSSDNIYFSWNVSSGSDYISIASSSNSAQVKGLSAGIAQITISWYKSGATYVYPRKVLVIVEAATTASYYITTSESIIKMTPSDSSKTITASLVDANGGEVSGAENYSFKWWADNYDIIDINPTNEQCEINPLSTGSVTIHVSHPKASTKDILLYISQYSEFAFEDTNITLTNGSTSFTSLQIPVTEVASIVECYSNNEDVVTANVTNSSSGAIVTLTPVSAGQATISANLLAKNDGITKLANTAKLVVAVKEADPTSIYIQLNNNSTGTTTAYLGGSTSLGAKLYSPSGSTAITDQTFSGLVWSITNPKLVKFTGSAASSDGSRAFGAAVKFEGLQKGETTITIHHDEALYDRIVKVNITGSGTPTIALSDRTKNLYENIDSFNLSATCKNFDSETNSVDWGVYVWDDDKEEVTSSKNQSQNIVEVTDLNELAESKAITVKAKDCGAVKIVATLMDTVNNTEISSDYCIVYVTEKPAVIFYLKNSDGTTKIIDSFDTVPCITSEDNLYFRLVPETSTIKNITLGDSSLVYYSTLSQEDQTIVSKRYNTDSETGETYFTLTGGSKTGATTLSVISSAGITGVCSINNEYNYHFEVDKVSMNGTPDDYDDDSSRAEDDKIYTIHYQVYPKNALVCVLFKTDDVVSPKPALSIASSHGDIDDRVESDTTKWVYNHRSSERNENGYFDGYIQLGFKGEINTSFTIEARNYNLPSQRLAELSSLYDEVGKFNESLFCCYSNNKLVASLTSATKYSRYDAASKTFFIGDGETIEFTITSNNAEKSLMDIYYDDVINNTKNLYFEKDNNFDNISTLGGKYENVAITYSVETVDASNNAPLLNLNFKLNQDFTKWGLSSSSSTDTSNDTVVYTAQIGSFCFKYKNRYANNSEVIEKFPVYMEVRNNKVK